MTDSLIPQDLETSASSAPLSLRNHALVLLLFALLTCLATWPLVTAPTHMLLGPPGDSLVWGWNFSWTRQALLVEHRIPFFGDFIFRPYPQAMLRHTHTFFYGFIYCLVSFIYENPYFWSNIFLLGSFVLAGYGTFLLARRLTGHTAGALLAGAVYAFCSLRMQRANAHLNILSSELIPFYLYFLLRGARENRARFFIAAALCFIATTWNEYYNSLFLILFTLLFLILTPLLRLNYGYGLRPRLRAVSTAILLAALLLLPYAWGLWRTVATMEILPPEGSDKYYVTLLNYLLPAAGHRLLFPWLWDFYHNGLPGNEGEATVFFGYCAIFLTLYGLVAIREKTREYKYFLVCLVFFLFMSFGTTLSLPFFSRAWEIPLPYFYFLKIPFFSDFRVPARFGGMVALCAALLAAFGFQAITRGMASRLKLGALTAGLIALVLLENLFAPYRFHFDPYDPKTIPLWLVEKIRHDPVPGALLNLPVTHEDWPGVWMQTMHHRPIVTGIGARPTAYQMNYYDTMDLRGLFQVNAKALPAGNWTKDEVGRLCYFFDLRFMMIPPSDDASKTDIASLIRRDLLPLEADYRERFAWLGVLKKQGPQFPIVMDCGSVLNNYYFIENFSQPAGGCRWLIGPSGRVAFRLDQPRDLTLRVGLGYPFHIPAGAQRLRITLGGRTLSEAAVGSGWSEQTCRIPRELLHAGYNFLTFHAALAASPAEKGLNQDTRKLSIMFSRIVLEKSEE